ncbi:unnamed protein product [Oncorhynchus mykiss]|uniref:LIM zinc-binding domain-containing protein n=1 Tax=Oncorhynchus mykiss TaxID=8022 RepID=A0A060Z7J7_ONCMY|nr:unnamed protein product [Oncorhynchus mykiss]
MAERYDCHYCKESLFGRKYVLREENPYCVKCYENLYSNTCEECKKSIGCSSRDLSYKDRHWHDDCFHCFKCSRSLVDKPFSTKDDQLLCTECYSNEYSSKCHECKKTIMPGKEMSGLTEGGKSVNGAFSWIWSVHNLLVMVRKLLKGKELTDLTDI